MTAGTGQQAQDSRHRTAMTGQMRQDGTGKDSGDRADGEAGQSRLYSQNRKDRTRRSKHDSKTG
jgi:hypothetical protein